jgi:hypothetical protein
VRYAEPPLDAFEEQLRQMVPAWLAMEVRLMFQGYHERGFAPAAADVAALTTLIGQAPVVRDFVHETAIVKFPSGRARPKARWVTHPQCRPTGATTAMPSWSRPAHPLLPSTGVALTKGGTP